MIENEYPIPSYMADVFEKPPGWIEVPKLISDEPPNIYAMDCEMVCTQNVFTYIV
jgi:RNA exonuclease 1